MVIRPLLLTSLIFAAALQAAPNPKRLAQVTAELEAIEKLGGDRLGYAETMLRFLAAGHVADAHGPQRRTEVSAYDLFSGALAIRESLQTDTITPTEERGANVAITMLKGPQVKSHDFKQMLKGRKVQQFPLAAQVPPDWFYAHFSSLSSALDMADYLNARGGAFYNRFSPAPVNTALKKRILHQLAIVENKEARIFYDAVIAEMAIVSSDFFFSMGTDISLVFNLRQKLIFETTMKSYRAQFQKAEPTSKAEVLNIGGKAVQALTTSDNRLRSYLIIDGNKAIISNSLPALERLLSIAARKEPSLAEMDEFRYMRSVYPADAANEGGFLYFSDAFIRRLVSAEVRIAEARRMNTAFRLANLEKMALLHRHLYGKDAASLPELMENIAKDSAQAKKLQGLFQGVSLKGLHASSAEMGALGYFKPNLESKLQAVSAAEANHYREFVRRYSEFWKEYFDPIGIRFRKTEKGMKAEICILPLIENSIYNGVKSLIAQRPAKHSITTIDGETLSLAATLELAATKPFRRDDTQLKLLNHLTGNVQLHVLDDNPTVDFESSAVLENVTRGRARPDVLIGAVAWSLFHPLRATFEAKDQTGAGAVLRALQEASQTNSRWQTSFAYDYQFNGKKITVFVLNIAGIITFRFHAWTEANQIHLTTTREYAERFIAGKKQSIAHNGNVLAIYRPNQILRERSALVQSNAEAMQRACFAHLGTAKLAAILFPLENMADALEKNYGLRPVCPVGGKYIIKSGAPEHDLLGTPTAAHADLAAAEALLKDFFSTNQLRIQFEFTEHGIMTEIETQ